MISLPVPNRQAESCGSRHEPSARSVTDPVGTATVAWIWQAGSHVRSREDLLETFRIEEALADEEKAPDYNVAPTKTSPTVLARPPRGGNEDAEPVRQLRNLKWGLVPSWAKDAKIGNRLINARAETVHEKPAFRRAFRSRRLLIPVDGFYEWFPTQQLGKSGSP
jgi:putative SOS response-associated peptidase YedK